MTDNIMFIPFIILMIAEVGAVVYMIRAWKQAVKDRDEVFKDAE